MFNHTRITIFPAGYPQKIAQAIIDGKPNPDGCIDDVYGTLVWTEPDAQEAYPDLLVINTKAERRVYRKPRLLSIHGGGILLSVMEDHGASGTMRSIKVLHLLIREYHPA